MGMYTQVRGVLCAKSIGYDEDLQILRRCFDELQEEFLKRDDLDRKWICENFHIMPGSNGSVWIFCGAEFRNYDNSMMEWIKFLAENMKVEGRIEFQYGENDVGDKDKVLIIKDSVIYEEEYVIYTEGYGFNC